MFQTTQNEDYLNLCIERVKKDITLTWVEQFLDITEERCDTNLKLQLNDIGCNLGQFWKGLKTRNSQIDYTGFDIEEIYLENARKIFPEKKEFFLLLDVTKEKPDLADITVVSATLEHFDDFAGILSNLLQTTSKMFILRSFMGDRSEKAIFVKDQSGYYYINQYSFREILELFDKHGYKTTVVRDRYTDSMPKYIGKGIVRTQYIIVGEKI